MKLEDLGLKNHDLHKRKSETEWIIYHEKNYYNMEQILADDWEIKNKEEDPITAEEYEENLKVAVSYKHDVIEAFKAGEKNNDLKYKELVENLRSNSNWAQPFLDLIKK